MGKLSPFSVICGGFGIPQVPPCGRVQLTDEQYEFQMDDPDGAWRCPICGASAEFDDEWEQP